MKNALILHGAGNTPDGNWFRWLEKELHTRNFTVWLPHLPNNDNPNRIEWIDFIFGNTDFIFSEKTIVFGHSAGGTLALRLLEQLPEGIVIDKAILVASYVELGTKEFTYPYKKDMLDIPFNWEKIKRSCKKFVFIHSDNDPYECGDSQGKILQEKLGGELVIKPGEGHFNLEKGAQYKEFPLLLNYI